MTSSYARDLSYNPATRHPHGASLPAVRRALLHLMGWEQSNQGWKAVQESNVSTVFSSSFSPLR